MKRSKTTISKATSYKEIGEFWSNHDLTEFKEQARPVEFEVDIQSEKRYYPLERDIAAEMNKVAKTRGVAAETLLNLWIKEKLLEQKA